MCVTLCEELNDDDDDDMSVFLLNATSLAKPNAIQLLETELLQMQCDTALITESWFNKYHQDAMLLTQVYSLYRRDHRFGKGGGVCAYICITQSHYLFSICTKSKLWYFTR